MKIEKIILRNFAAVKNAMSANEIMIDFSKSITKICLLIAFNSFILSLKRFSSIPVLLYPNFSAIVPRQPTLIFCFCPPANKNIRISAALSALFIVCGYIRPCGSLIL